MFGISKIFFVQKTKPLEGGEKILTKNSLLDIGTKKNLKTEKVQPHALLQNKL
jgi:hypothetical protein